MNDQKQLSETTKNPILKIGFFELYSFVFNIEASGLP